MKGRRPSQVARAAEAMQSLAAGQSPEVQEKLDAAFLAVLSKFEAAIEKRIKEGDLAEMKLPDLLKELRGIKNAYKGPNMNLMMQQAPVLPQIPQEPGRRDVAIEAASEGPERDGLLEEQRRFLERNG